MTTKIEYDFKVDKSQIEPLLKTAAEKYKVEMKNATVTGFDGTAFTFVDEVEGREADLPKTVDAVCAQINKKVSGTVNVVEKKLPATYCLYFRQSRNPTLKSGRYK